MQAEYEARRIATQLNLRRYYNECVQVMAREEAGEIDVEEAMELFLELDAVYARAIVDDIAPRKRILEI